MWQWLGIFWGELCPLYWGKHPLFGHWPNSDCTLPESVLCWWQWKLNDLSATITRWLDQLIESNCTRSRRLDVGLWSQTPTLSQGAIGSQKSLLNLNSWHSLWHEIKSDTGQHSQFLRCLLQIMDYLKDRIEKSKLEALVAWNSMINEN